MTQEEKCPVCDTAVPANSLTCPHCQSNLQLAAMVVSLNERVARLEQNRPPQPVKPTPPPPKPSPEKETAVPLPPVPSPKRTYEIFQSDFWLNKIGIGLVLLALAFLFNYAVEQGWLTPPVRVAIGLITGSTLLGIGYRIYGRRRHFSQVLLGGGLVAYYFTGFAAFQLYELVPYPIAFGFMSLVTLLAFFLSLRQDEAVLTFIGLIGGLWTPFLLYTGTDNVSGLIAHTILLVGAAVAIYWFCGWQLVLWTAVFVGWLFVGGSAVTDPGPSDRWPVQGGILFMLIAAWLIPVWREITAVPHKLPPTRLGFADSLIPARLQRFLNKLMSGHILIPPFLAMLSTWALWTLSDREVGSLTLTGALIFGAAAWFVGQTPVSKQVTQAHWLTAVLLLTASLAQFLSEGEWLILAWATEIALLHLAAARWDFPQAAKAGIHVFAAVVGGWLVGRLLAGQVGTAVWNTPALIDLGVIGLAAIVPFVFRSKYERRIYWLAAHIAMLAWLWRELGAMDNGQGLVSVAWGIHALLLLGVSLKYRWHLARATAVATFFVLSAKLILVDLSALRAVWRILLFAGVGGVFLLISYYYRTLLPDEDVGGQGE